MRIFGKSFDSFDIKFYLTMIILILCGLVANWLTWKEQWKIGLCIWVGILILQVSIKKIILMGHRIMEQE